MQFHLNTEVLFLKKLNEINNIGLLLTAMDISQYAFCSNSTT